MKRKILVVVFLLGLPVIAMAGNIFEVSSSGLAEVRVIVVDSPSQADLCVYVTNRLAEARGKDEVWFYTEHQGLADAKICFVKHLGQADLKVYFVNSISMAGWKSSSKYRGRFK